MTDVKVEHATLIALIEQHILQVYGLTPLRVQLTLDGEAYAEIPDGEDSDDD